MGTPEGGAVLPRPRRQAERSDATRRRIIAAARGLFAEHGYDATSLEALTMRAGVSKGALYHHYADKSDVLAAAYEDLEHELSERLVTVASGSADPVEALRAGCHEFLDACRDPAIRRLALVDAPAHLGWERWREIDAQYGLGLLRVGLQAIADSGRGVQDQIDERAHLLLAALMEGSLLIAQAEDAAGARAAIGRLVDDQIDALTR